MIDIKDFDDGNVLVRNYKISDYLATLEILKQLHEMYEDNLSKIRWRESSGLRQFKPNLKRITLVVELKSTNEIIGMGVIEGLKDLYGCYTGYLNNWAIKEEYIGKHVGKILAERAIQLLESWGCVSIRINLGYGAPKKLLDVFGRTGFKPIMVVLEKKIGEKQKNGNDEISDSLKITSNKLHDYEKINKSI